MGVQKSTNVLCSHFDWRTYRRVFTQDERRRPPELHWRASLEWSVSNGRHGILACTLVRNDENTEQGVEDMRKTTMKSAQSQPICKAASAKALLMCQWFEIHMSL